MHALLVVALLGAAPVQPKIAAPGLDFVQMDQKKADFFLEYLAQELGQHGFQVITAKQISAVVGLERQKELLGCADATQQSCLAELAGALGVDGLLLGTIANLDGQYRFALRIVSAKDASVLAQQSGRATSDTQAVDWLSDAAAKLAADTKVAIAPAQSVVTVSDAHAGADANVSASAPSSGGLRRLAWIPAGAAVACLGVGTYFEVQAADRERALQQSGSTEIDSQAKAQQALADGQRYQNTAIGFFAAAGVIGAGAVAMFVWGAPKEPSTSPAVTALVTPGGAAVAVSGSFP